MINLVFCDIFEKNFLFKRPGFVHERDGLHNWESVKQGFPVLIEAVSGASEAHPYKPR